MRRRFRREIVAVEFGGEVVAAVDGGAAGGVEISQRAIGAQAVLPVGAIDAGGGTYRPDRFVGVDLVIDTVGRGASRTKGRNEIRIPARGVVRNEIGPAVVFVGVWEH